MVNLNDPRRADARGWGPGYPDCQPARMVPFVVGGVSFPQGCRREIHDLAFLLVGESLQRKFIPRLDSPGCWGYDCRPIKNPDGTLTNIPSNHSWGLAFDINAPHNPFGGATHQIPTLMAKLWGTYGFRWGGDYSGTKDWMHFEFMGTPAECKQLTTRARKELTDVALNKDQEQALEFVIGERLFLDGHPEPKEPGPRREGWRFAKRVPAK